MSGDLAKTYPQVTRDVAEEAMALGSLLLAKQVRDVLQKKDWIREEVLALVEGVIKKEGHREMLYGIITELPEKMPIELTIILDKDNSRCPRPQKKYGRTYVPGISLKDLITHLAQMGYNSKAVSTFNEAKRFHVIHCSKMKFLKEPLYRKKHTLESLLKGDNGIYLKIGLEDDEG